MASTNFTDKGYISKYGGGILKVREVSDAGVYTSGDDYTFGYLQETGHKYEKPQEDVQDETGATVKSIFGNVSNKLTGTFMQTNSALLDFLRDTTENRFYQLYYKSTPTGDLNGVTQELFGAICQIRPTFEVKSGVRRVNFEITFLKNDAEITIATPNSVFGSVETDTVTIGAGKYHEYVEN